MPRVSVIMGVSNGAATLRRAIRSIQDQTFTEWEYVICDDGSTDGTWAILQEAAAEDGRIRLIRLEKNRGLAASLNRCIDSARGEYLARQDADDVSHAERLAEQVRFLDERRDVSAVGTHVALFDDRGVAWGEVRHPEAPIARDWVRGPKIIHASAVMRARDVREAGRYNECALRVEDYDLWLRMVARGAQIATIPRVLYFVHWDRSDYGRRRYVYRVIESKIRWNGYRAIRVPLIAYAYVLKPLLVGLLPQFVVYGFHFAKYRIVSRKTPHPETLPGTGSRPTVPGSGGSGKGT